jgi:hypothetical protein
MAMQRHLQPTRLAFHRKLILVSCFKASYNQTPVKRQIIAG